MSNLTFVETIRTIFNGKPILKDIDNDQDFFDIGASSLTVVDMQMQIEKNLGFSVPTSTLMKNPTINGWANAYSEVA
jgi:acyl carrier protein